MALPDTDVFTILKDVASWLSAPVFALVAWAWNKNDREHEAMRTAQEAMRKSHEELARKMSDSGSKLNDRIMDHIDDQVKETRIFVVQEDTKLMAELTVQRGHIGKIFDKLEEASHRSEDRHRELLTAIHTGLAGKADK